MVLQSVGTSSGTAAALGGLDDSGYDGAFLRSSWDRAFSPSLTAATNPTLQATRGAKQEWDNQFEPDMTAGAQTWTYNAEYEGSQQQQQYQGQQYRPEQSMHAPLCGPEMFTPLQAGHDGALQHQVEYADEWLPDKTGPASGGSKGARTSSSSPSSAALQAAAASYQQLQQEWQQQRQMYAQQKAERELREQQQRQKLQQLGDKHRRQQPSATEGSTANSPRDQLQQQQQQHQEQARGWQDDAVAVLQMPPKLQKQLQALQRQRELQHRYQHRPGSQAYASRARTPSPVRSTSPPALLQRSLTPPRQVAPSRAAATATASTCRHPGAASGAAAAAAQGSKPTLTAAGAPARARNAAPGPPPAGNLAAAAAAAAAGEAAAVAAKSSGTGRSGRLVGPTSAAKHASQQRTLPVISSAGLSLRRNSKDGGIAGTTTRGTSTAARLRNAQPAGAAAAAAASTGGSSQAASAAAKAAVAALRRSGAPAAPDSSSKAAARSAARAAVAAAIAAQAGEHTASIRSSTSTATTAIQDAAAAVVMAAADCTAGLQSKGSKLQQLKDCNQRLRRSLQYRHELQEQVRARQLQHSQAARAARATASARAHAASTTVRPQDCAAVAGGAAVAAAAAAHTLPKPAATESAPEHCIQPEKLERQQHAAQLHQQSLQRSRQLGMEASNLAVQPAADDSASSLSSSSSSSSKCSEAAHELEHWQQQQQQGPEAALSWLQAPRGSSSNGSSGSSSSSSLDGVNGQPAAAANGNFSSSNRSAQPAVAAAATWAHGKAAGTELSASSAARTGSKTGSDDADTASSISFMANHFPADLQQAAGHVMQQSLDRQYQQQQQQQQQQPGLGQDLNDADMDWPPRKHLRTALFASPTPEQQQRRQRQRRQVQQHMGDGNSSSSDGGSSRSSSPALSWLDEDDAAAAAEQQIQLLLNNTGLKGPDSPSWAVQEQQQQQAAVLPPQLQLHADSTAAAPAPAAADGAGDIADLKLSRAEEDFLQLLEVGQPSPTDVAQQQWPESGSRVAGEVSSSNKQHEPPALQADMQQQQQQQEQHSPKGIINHPPWRPPGVTPSIASPPPPIRGERSSNTSSGQKQQQLLQKQRLLLQRHRSRSRSLSPPRLGAAAAAAAAPHETAAAAAGSARSSGARAEARSASAAAAAAAASLDACTQTVQEQDCEAAAASSLLLQHVPGLWQADFRQGHTYGTIKHRQLELQQLRQRQAEYLEQQQQPPPKEQQPVSYQVQLQAYLDTQQGHHQWDQQEVDPQQDVKHWQQQTWGDSIGATGAAYKAPAVSAGAAAPGSAADRAAQLAEQPQWPAELVRYRLSLPESCDGSVADTDVSWAAAALDAAAAAGDAGSSGDGAGGADAGDADAVCEEFAALLEAADEQAQHVGLWPQQQYSPNAVGSVYPGGTNDSRGLYLRDSVSAAAEQQQQLEVQMGQLPLEDWGSRIEVGQPGRSGLVRDSLQVSSRASWSALQPGQQHVHTTLARSLPASFSCGQQQTLMSPGKGALATSLHELTSQQQQLDELRLAVDSAVDATVERFNRQWLLRRAVAAWSRSCTASQQARQLLQDASAASADTFAAARKHRLLSHCWAGWTAAVLVGSSARSAATQLLQRVVQREVLLDWQQLVLTDRTMKQQVLRAWNSQVQQQQVRQGCLFVVVMVVMVVVVMVVVVVVWCSCAEAVQLFAILLSLRSPCVSGPSIHQWRCVSAARGAAAPLCILWSLPSAQDSAKHTVDKKCYWN